MNRRAVMAGAGAVLLSARVSRAATSPAPMLETPLFDRWAARFVRPSGRVVDDGNKGISHSEGQGYGMLLAVFADDRPAFDRLWTWTRDHLAIREDALLAWRYDPAASPRVADLNNASDGDILVAWALALAAGRWGEASYRLAGAAIARSLVRNAVVEDGDRRWLMPGAAGFSSAERKDGPVVNLSYWVFPAFPSLADLAPEYDWRALAQSGLDLIAAARFGPHELPADWTARPGRHPAPAAGLPAVFGWNALRVPLYLALAEKGWGGNRALLAPFAALWPAGGAADPQVVPLAGNRRGEDFGSSGYRAVPAVVACALEGAPYPRELQEVEPEPYYPATLRLLTLAVARQRYPECF